MGPTRTQNNIGLDRCQVININYLQKNTTLNIEQVDAHKKHKKSTLEQRKSSSHNNN